MRFKICMNIVVFTLNLPKNVSLSLTSIHEPRLSSRSNEWNFPSWLYNSRNLLARYVAKPASCDCNAHVSALPRRCCWYERIPIILQILSTETWNVHGFFFNRFQFYFLKLLLYGNSKVNGDLMNILHVKYVEHTESCTDTQHNSHKIIADNLHFSFHFSLRALY